MTNERKLLNEIARSHPEWLELVRALLYATKKYHDPWVMLSDDGPFYAGRFSAYSHSLDVVTGREPEEIDALIAYCIRYESRLKKVLYADKEES